MILGIQIQFIKIICGKNEFKRILHLVNLTSATTWHQPVEEFIPIVHSVLTVNK